MFQLVNPRFPSILGRMATLFVLSGVIVLITMAIVFSLVQSQVVVLAVLGGLIYLAVIVGLSLVGTVATVVTYAECRFREHNPVHTPVLADEIDRA